MTRAAESCCVKKILYPSVHKMELASSTGLSRLCTYPHIHEFPALQIHDSNLDCVRVHIDLQEKIMNSCGSGNRGTAMTYADIRDIHQSLLNVLWCKCYSDSINSIHSTMHGDLDEWASELAC
jgi:hypothetical protein